MVLNGHTPEVTEWLTRNGWSPGRDIGAKADELVRIRIEDAARQGWPMEELEVATRFIRSYGELELSYPWTAPKPALIFNPTVGYDRDVEVFDELAEGLGKKVFPVAYEAHEPGLWVIDQAGRFFYLHYTGGYFLGENEYDALAGALHGRHRPDAEDFYV
ncbi:SUKH-3 domain-containing protein [Streptomyces triculaminicus]|uniref:SUKH-3 domain-containing protein n=1 Tax=Streptomyces triculaminicus TaxID=2816232 RepID=UPI0027DB79D6|nr:SUKH-3 domain-containing protein [Streptomyces triculaminicus]